MFIAGFHIWTYDIETGEKISLHKATGGLKGCSVNPDTGEVIYVQNDGIDSRSWQVRSLSGKPRRSGVKTDYFLKMYKARWFVGNAFTDGDGKEEQEEQEEQEERPEEEEEEKEKEKEEEEDGTKDGTDAPPGTELNNAKPAREGQCGSVRYNQDRFEVAEGCE